MQRIDEEIKSLNAKPDSDMQDRNLDSAVRIRADLAHKVDLLSSARSYAQNGLTILSNPRNKLQPISPNMPVIFECCCFIGWRYGYNVDSL